MSGVVAAVCVGHHLCRRHCRIHCRTWNRSTMVSARSRRQRIWVNPCGCGVVWRSVGLSPTYHEDGGDRVTRNHSNSSIDPVTPLSSPVQARSAWRVCQGDPRNSGRRIDSFLTEPSALTRHVSRASSNILAWGGKHTVFVLFRRMIEAF